MLQVFYENNSQIFLKCNKIAFSIGFFLTFVIMKRKFAIFNLVLMAVVLLATAYQSIHAFSHEHFEQHLHEHHEQKKAKLFSGAGHEHEDEDCATCDFHFDFFVAPQEICLKLDFPFKPFHYSFSGKESNSYFAGSLFALRAPPFTV